MSGARKCGYCDRDFQPAEEGQLYCSRNHAHAAAKKRKEQRERLATTGRNQLCPHPYKRSYSTTQQAAYAEYEISQGLTLYRCPCGALHYGHGRETRHAD